MGSWDGGGIRAGVASGGGVGPGISKDKISKEFGVMKKNVSAG